MGRANYYELSSAICGVWGVPRGAWALWCGSCCCSEQQIQIFCVAQSFLWCPRECVCVRLLGSTLLEDYATVGLSKVHLPWLRHRNILEACNDNISSKRQQPLQRPLQPPPRPSPLSSLGSAAARGGFGIWEVAAAAVAALGCCYFHFAAMMKL